MEGTNKDRLLRNVRDLVAAPFTARERFEEESNIVYKTMKGPEIDLLNKPRSLERTGRSEQRSAFVSGSLDLAKKPGLKHRQHVLLPVGLAPAEESAVPIQTNKFYTELFLGDQKGTIYPTPYTMRWSGTGIDIGHSDADQRVYGPDPNLETVQYYFNPVGIVSISLSATESPSSLNLEHPSMFSITANLSCSAGLISVPIVTGSAFVSALYTNLTPRITSGVMFRAWESIPFTNGRKWRFHLEVTLLRRLVGPH